MSTPACQCVKDTAQECAYGIAPQCAPEEWVERNRRERGMPPTIRLPEDTEEQAKGLEEPRGGKEKKKSKWSIRIIRGRQRTKEEENGSKTHTKEEGEGQPLSTMKKEADEERTEHEEEEDSQEARHKEEERCKRYQSYYIGCEGDDLREHEIISDVENESGYESYYACRERDEEFFEGQEEGKHEEKKQGNGEGGETEQSPPPAAKEGGH